MLHNIMNNLLLGIRGTLHSLTFPLRAEAMLGRKIMACVFTIGERSEEDCIESVKRQSLPVHRIEVVRDVSPISAASNRALDLAADADYLLWVDADMVLHRDCAMRLLRLMREDVLYALAPLRDPVFGLVGYIKLLNMHIVREHGLRFRDVLGCDMDMFDQAQRLCISPQTFTFPRFSLGVHHPTYTARELFRKCQIQRKKRGNRLSPRLIDNLVKKYHATQNPVLLAGILGELLPNPDPSSGESLHGSGLMNWDRVRGVLGDVPEDLTYGF
ncbi:MAG TPA: glycosyltransferase family A protein [Deltaproteobacteria bacterium]|nr:glycosyltransferase family A protein [Deltaproteobacteria bacterium]HOI05880.1 glycosyltransferase family A protein [Deltaproteobacteria bacterium]